MTNNPNNINSKTLITVVLTALITVAILIYITTQTLNTNTNTNIINPFQKISPDKQPYTTPQEKQQNTQQQLYLNCCYTKNALVKMCVMPVFLQGKQAFL